MTGPARPLRTFVLLAWLLAAVTVPPAPAGAAEKPAEPGTGWVATRLDMDVTPRPDDAALRVEGTLELRLDAERSLGPVLTLNTRAPWLRFLRAETPGAVADLNDSLPGTPGVRTARQSSTAHAPCSSGVRIWAASRRKRGARELERGAGPSTLSLAARPNAGRPRPSRERNGAL